MRAWMYVCMHVDTYVFGVSVCKHVLVLMCARICQSIEHSYTPAMVVAFPSHNPKP